ncbi:MAG: lysoplasmalogenase [Actinomycetota bacterium]
MSVAAWVVLGLAGVFAVSDWIAVSPRVQSRLIEYACKPATTALLVAVALLLEPLDPAQRGWFVAALILSLAGDVFLMLPKDAFVPGLASFLLAHVAYVGGLRLEDPSGRVIAVTAVAVVGVGLPVLLRMIRGARAQGHPEMAVPLTAYVCVISAMVVFAFGARDAVAAGAAVLFFTSDAMIGWDRFVRPLPWVRPAIMATYHLAQAGFVLSLLR